MAYDAFLKLCINATTKEINAEITEILDLLTYDRFDVYFEKYLRICLSKRRCKQSRSIPFSQKGVTSAVATPLKIVFMFFLLFNVIFYFARRLVTSACNLI